VRTPLNNGKDVENVELFIVLSKNHARKNSAQPYSFFSNCGVTLGCA
jgi:hypothetical protein